MHHGVMNLVLNLKLLKAIKKIVSTYFAKAKYLSKWPKISAQSLQNWAEVTMTDR
jgi:hypothetical protein